jgi:hypothetical protein
LKRGAWSLILSIKNSTLVVAPAVSTTFVGLDLAGRF